VIDPELDQPETADMVRTSRRTMNVPESQRTTHRLSVRMSETLRDKLEGDAEAYGLTLAQVIEVYRETAEASGKLAAALRAAAAKA